MARKPKKARPIVAAEGPLILEIDANGRRIAPPDSRIGEDGWFTLDIDEMFDTYVRGLSKTWMYDRSKSVGASEVFSCARQVFFKKHGYEMDPDHEERWGATRRGDLIEQYHVAPALTTQCGEKGVELLYAGSDQVTFLEGRASATPDGLFTRLPIAPLRIKAGGDVIEIPDFKSTCLGLEIKSIDPRANLLEERSKHRGQSQVGMGMIREKTEYQPDHWLILYIDASFLDNVTPFLIEYDPSVYEVAKTRAEAIWQYDDPLAFEPEGKYVGECDHCPFKVACGEAVMTEWFGTKDETNSADNIIEHVEYPVERYLLAKANCEAADEELKRAAQALKDSLLEVQARRVKSDKWSVTWSTQKGRRITDWKTLVAEHKIDVEPYTREGASFDKLTVTPKKEDLI
jgi:hypothetical protein